MIQKDDVKNLGTLARIELTDAEIEGLQQEFSAILDYVSELERVELKEEMPQVGTVYNVLREDQDPHQSGLYTDTILGQMPATEAGYMKVKKIL